MISCPEANRGLLCPPAFKFSFRQTPISHTVSIGRDPPCVCHPHLPDNRPCFHRLFRIRFHPPRANPHATRHAGPTPHPNRHTRHPTLREDDEDVEIILARPGSPQLASLQHPQPHSGQFRSATPRLLYISGSRYSKSPGSAVPGNSDVYISYQQIKDGLFMGSKTGGLGGVAQPQTCIFCTCDTLLPRVASGAVKFPNSCISQFVHVNAIQKFYMGFCTLRWTIT